MSVLYEALILGSLIFYCYFGWKGEENQTRGCELSNVRKRQREQPSSDSSPDWLIHVNLKGTRKQPLSRQKEVC